MQSQSNPEMEIDRSATWVHARQDKDGNYKDPKVKEIAEEIVCYSFTFKLNFHITKIFVVTL